MTSPIAPESPALLPFLVAFLTPLLLTAGITDTALARRAVLETIEAHRATGSDQLLTTAQIVGSALASLDNLRLSASPAQSPLVTLKLRGGANALNRATQRTTAALETQRRDAADAADHQSVLAALDSAPGPELSAHDPIMASASSSAPDPIRTPALAPAATPDQAAIPDRTAKPAAAAKPVPTSIRSWADAMTDYAAESSRTLAKLRPDQRRAEIMRIGALNDAARHLRKSGAAAGKASLLATTSLSSG
jgi:hypothetical protein